MACLNSTKDTRFEASFDLQRCKMFPQGMVLQFVARARCCEAGGSGYGQIFAFMLLSKRKCIDHDQSQVDVVSVSSQRCTQGRLVIPPCRSWSAVGMSDPTWFKSQREAFLTARCCSVISSFVAWKCLVGMDVVSLQYAGNSRWKEAQATVRV